MTKTEVALAEALKRICECDDAKAENVANNLYRLLVVLYDESIRGALNRIAEEEIVERALQRWEDGGR